jgi:hypothetical protein
MDEGYEVYCGLDVGKSEHHAAALNAAGERVFDKPLPQDEARPRDLFTGLQQHGRVLVIVDQPNTIGALPIAVARDCGCTVAYLQGLAMRKAADLYPGKSKTDAGDAFIIAETARAMPHTLRVVDRDSEVLAALKVLSGFDADLTHECTTAIIIKGGRRLGRSCAAGINSVPKPCLGASLICFQLKEERF